MSRDENARRTGGQRGTARRAAAGGAARRRTSGAARRGGPTRKQRQAEARRARALRRGAIIACAVTCLLALVGGFGLRYLKERADRAAIRPGHPQASAPAPEQPNPNAPEEPSEAPETPADSQEGATEEGEPSVPAAEVSPEEAEPAEAPEARPEDADGETAAPTEAEDAGASALTIFDDAPGAETAFADMPEAPVPEARDFRAMGEIVESARPDNKKYKYEQRFVADGEKVDEYVRANPIAMPAGEDYAQVDGILTFRGNNYRDTGAFGTVPDDASGLSVVWMKKIGSIDSWTGVGWTGQASIVRWPEETRQIMNLNAAKKDKDGLKEVIYGTLDGHIYFLDLDDGEETRGSIKVPSSIKGSVSVDPRGYPLLYCGQGIPEVNGSSVKIGTRIFSLIDQEVLFFLNGRDDFCLRRWYAFDCSPLVDAASDTLLQLGENAIAYTLKLNTDYDPQAGTISVDPVVDRMIYKSEVSTRMGMENSPSVYDHYAYYTDNSGLLTCLDLNTLKAVWLGDVGDDSDASTVLEEDEEGVWLYTVCELDQNGTDGNVYCRRFNALTGEEMWNVPVRCYRYSKDVDAGGFATPALGKGSLGDLVYFNVCRTKESSGELLAVNKRTGEVVWSQGTGAYSWSSPVCVYDSQGKGYLVYGNSNGALKLCDGLTGDKLAEVDLGANIEGSPAIFDDMLVVGTRGSRIYGVRITN